MSKLAFLRCALALSFAMTVSACGDDTSSPDMDASMQGGEGGAAGTAGSGGSGGSGGNAGNAGNGGAGGRAGNGGSGGSGAMGGSGGDGGSSGSSGSGGDASVDDDAGVDNDGGDFTCAIDDDCNDDNACTDDECTSGACSHDAVSVDDDDVCTIDSCDQSTGVAHVAVAIDDGDGCTVDSCDPVTGVAHAPVDVDDSDGCTVDACASPAGTITHTFCESNVCDTSDVCIDSAITSVTSSTPVGIPTGPAVVTSTVEVTGAGTILSSLEVRMSLTHTFSADLDITLQSPEGTVVTLTTDNGAGNDNTFNGTLWSDDANPEGALPYVNNDGMATDNAYVNLTAATPLTPEESFGAFYGEDPNGTWTITISDDLAGDGGSLDSWGLDITTVSSLPTVTVDTQTQSTPLAIPDGDLITSTIEAPASLMGSTLCSITVTTDISHTFPGDLDVTLTSPEGTIVTLTTDNGADNDNVFAGTLWDDKANSGGQVPYTNNDGLVTDHLYVNGTAAAMLVPEEPLAAFNGEDPVGTWTLTVSDDLSNTNVGMLNSWSIHLGRCFR